MTSGYVQSLGEALERQRHIQYTTHTHTHTARARLRLEARKRASECASDKRQATRAEKSQPTNEKFSQEILIFCFIRAHTHEYTNTTHTLTHALADTAPVRLCACIYLRLCVRAAHTPLYNYNNKALPENVATALPPRRALLRRHYAQSLYSFCSYSWKSNLSS